MNRSLWHWWPIVPGLILLYFGAISFFEKYPEKEVGSRVVKSNMDKSDSIPSLIQHIQKLDSLSRFPGLSSGDSLAKLRSPFRPIHNAKLAAIKASSSPKIDPPSRKFILKGTVGNSVATISGHDGKKIIVKVGEFVDSATVISIESNRVILKDRAGKFEILQE